MKNKLQQHFPMIRTQEEILTEIKDNEKLRNTFCKWCEEEQQEFLDFCTGVRGIKMLYDSFSKEILNPELYPERLNELLSLLINQSVRIVSVLPNDSIRIADENSLIITDIVVELEDGSIANVEIQKIGYNFPGQRSACYSADLLLRQYKRIKSREKKKFSYKDIKAVFTIILFEKSTKEFYKFPDIYIHHFEQRSDSGLQIELLQKYIFISLDIFKKIHQNNSINNKLDAWLAFLCMDDPEKILIIVEKFPEFEQMYEQAYNICCNMEEVMGMFSKELYELDKNTVQYMMDEMQDEINQKKAELAEKKKEAQVIKNEIQETKKEVQKMKSRLEEKGQEVQKMKSRLEEKGQEVQEMKDQLEEKGQEVQEIKGRLEEKNGEVEELKQIIAELKKQIVNNSER
ncbi:MAG: PD-(D/E)XK nuclease family transposase [Oliverpabstia sp.]|nr:PD-(D/E)XK nuclease family transposase [Oliverpabstia sp.]